jgi:hypothetical protein
MIGFVVRHEQLVQQFLAVPPVARAHRRRLRHGEQQLARLADHLTRFPRGQFHHRLRTLIPFLHQSPALFRRRVQRQSHQRGARQEHEQQQGNRKSETNRLMIFRIPQYSTPNLTNPERHGVSALVCTPKKVAL